MILSLEIRLKKFDKTSAFVKYILVFLDKQSRTRWFQALPQIAHQSILGMRRKMAEFFVLVL